MKKSLSVLLALGMAALLQGCDQGNQPAPSASPASPKKLRLGFVTNNANDYWSIVRVGCDLAVSQLGDVDLVFRTPLERTAAAQQEIVKQMIADGIDGIAISPIDPEKQTEFLDSISTNILLVCADSDAPKSRRACYIGTDNVAAGKQAAELLKAALPAGGKIVLLVGYPTAENMSQRIEGIKDGLADTTIQIVDTLADESNVPLAEKNGETALAKYPDLAGMAGLNSYSGPAILQAVRSAGKIGQVKIICFDEESDTLAGIAAGDIYGTVGQKPFGIGRETIVWMYDYLRGDKAQAPTGKVFIPTRVVTKDNVTYIQNTRRNILESEK
jgi:ribose transport system substrate-binding protein